MGDKEQPVCFDTNELMSLMDSCLIAIGDGKQIPVNSLDAMPPWRAVMMARVAEKANVPIEGGYTGDQLRAKAREAGGDANPGWLTGRECRTCTECGSTSWDLNLERHTLRCSRYPRPRPPRGPRNIVQTERVHFES